MNAVSPGDMQAPHAPAGSAPQTLRARLLARWAEVPMTPEAQALNGQRVMLSGTSGQLGLWLLRMLLKADARVEALGFRTEMDFAHPNLRWHRADLTSPDALRPLLAQGALAPTVLFCAPLWFLTPQLPSFAQGGVRRIVAFGSTSMHVKADSGHASERALVARLQAGEAALRVWEAETGGQATLLRPTMIYGVGLDANVCAVARLLRRLRVFPIATRADGLRQPAHLEDLAHAVFAVLARTETTAGKAYDLSGGEVLRYRDFVTRIAALAGVGGGALPLPMLAELLDMAGRLLGRNERLHGEIARRMRQDLAFSHAEAARDFGYAPRRFLDAARQPEGLAFVI